MRHVRRYVKERQHDITTPDDILRGLYHDGGIANCALQPFTIHRDEHGFVACQNGLKDPRVIPFRRVGKFNYGEYNDRMFTVRVYPYSFGNETVRHFGVGFLLLDGQIPPSALSPLSGDKSNGGICPSRSKNPTPN